ncbi:MAG: esterase, partial [Anaerolineae bacterium]|nr:esterase [Anaerolineae bacterium]
IRRFTGGYEDEMVYFNNPIQFVANEQDPNRLYRLYQLDIIIAAGRDDRLMSSSRELSRVLWDKGIGNALREWEGWAHDWPYWEQMLRLYINGSD